jgi:hypothetical protein
MVLGEVTEMTNATTTLGVDMTAPKLTEAQRSALLSIAVDDYDAIPGHLWDALQSLKAMGLADAAGNITDVGRAALRGES